MKAKNTCITFKLVAAGLILASSNPALAETEATNTVTQEAAQSLQRLSASAQKTIQTGILKSKIETTLLTNQHIRTFNIDATEEQGIVTLSGQVTKSIEKDYAEQLMYQIDGVQEVINDIEVTEAAERRTLEKKATQLTSSIKDISITGAIKAKLLANPNVAGMAIDVTTQNAQVTLEGVSKTLIEKELIEMIAENTKGVEDVVNLIEVTE